MKEELVKMEKNSGHHTGVYLGILVGIFLAIIAGYLSGSLRIEVALVSLIGWAAGWYFIAGMLHMNLIFTKHVKYVPKEVEKPVVKNKQVVKKKKSKKKKKFLVKLNE